MKQPVRGGAAKVPVIMQMEALECGAACLAMILAYYGKWIPLEQVRSDCGVSRDGSNAAHIVQAAREYKLEVEAYRMEPQDLKKDGYFPCIVHWEFNHFVVCDGFRGNKVYLNDPARGRVTLSMEEFDKGFTGICIFFKPTDEFVPSGERRSTITFVRKRMHGARAALLLVMLLSVITAIFGLINPAMTRLFIDRLLSGRNPDWAYPFLILMIILAAMQLLTAWIHAIYMLRINAKMAISGNMTFMWKLLRLPMEFFSQRMTGDLLIRQGTNATIASTMVNTFAPILLNTVMMVIYLAVMLRQSVMLTMIGLASMILNLVTSIIISSKRVNITRVQQRDTGQLSSTTLTGIKMIETIKSSGAENGFFSRWAGFQASVNHSQVAFDKINAYFGIIPQISSAACTMIVLYFGLRLTMEHKFTIGMVTSFQTYLGLFMAPVASLLSAGALIQEMRTDMERIEDVMEYPDAITFKTGDAGPEGQYAKLKGEVEVKNLTFGYSKLAPPLIENFSMHIKPGSKVAFVGASGCGKSTLSKLISGLYQPWSGEILFDGKRADLIDHDVITGSLAVVDQDIILFEDTIANNIRMWDQTIEDFEVILAARDAQIHDDIMARNGGYSSMLEEGGKNLSGGQRQRLEIARVLAQDPSIVILDEATSALDAKTEYHVIKSITDRGITCIVIAHRLSTIRDCEEIIVLDKGKVVERGTHQQLFDKGGLYTTLVTSE